ncbi:MAG: hypothetical protein V9G98_01870 [Candidatus Competibacter sp.]
MSSPLDGRKPERAGAAAHQRRDGRRRAAHGQRAAGAAREPARPAARYAGDQQRQRREPHG